MENFKIGDKIYCVDNNDYELNLTLHKEYVVKDITENYLIYIIDDLNNQEKWGMFRFISLKEYRLLKIKEIL